MNELAEQKIVQHLFEAHAAELMVAQTLTAHIAMTPKGDYRDGLEVHLRQTKNHASRIQKHLARRDQERGLMQVGYGFAQGVVSQVLAVSKLPVDLVRGMSGEEKLLKNARDECANEAMEIAMYLAIEELAKAVGDTETVNLAASIREEEERMLERLLEIIPRLASDVIRAEVRGNPRFDVRTIGAVDAARSVAGTAARSIARSANRAGRKAESTPSQARRAPSPTTLSTKQSTKRTSSGSTRKRTTTSSTAAGGTKQRTATTRKRTAAKARG